MFAYCNNNPVLYEDSSGNLCRACIIAIPDGGGDTAEDDEEYTFESILDKFRNSDNSYSIYDNQRNKPPKAYHEQVFAFSASGASFSLLEGDLTLGSVSATLITGGWEFENWELSLFDLGHAEASLGIEDYHFSAGAMASLWTPSISFSVGIIDITIEGHVGSVGFTAELGRKGVKIGAAEGYGASIAISWD